VSFLEELAAKRKKLLDGIDVNEGDINLRIFEDFYPDEAHFIYELLQNAEDAGAKEVTFLLYPDRCVLEHDGTRQFNEEDVKAITGIFNSSKTDSADKIGKFGVGFKSVFVYTDTPAIYSQRFSFRIEELILPRSIEPAPCLGGKTRFELPFNKPKMPRSKAFSEVRDGLQQLSEISLLFLRSIQCINWRIGTLRGSMLREEHSNSHIEILVENTDGQNASSHWLRFVAPLDSSAGASSPDGGLSRQNVAVAFELRSLDDSRPFDASRPIAKQFRISPAKRGLVSVFFPAEKETSGLRFHLHAPFVPELSRASIKNSPENTPLFEKLGRLAAASLHDIKRLGFLSGEFLAVLPNKEDPLPERYGCIREAIIEEMRLAPLVPKHGGGHGAASKLLQARAPLKALLTKQDLAFLFGDDESPEWAIGATQRNSDQDRFLASLSIQNWDVEDLKELLERTTQRENVYARSNYNADVVQWLASQTDEWLQQLYGVLFRHCDEDDDFGELENAQIVRLTSGEMVVGPGSYFPSESATKKDPFPRVASGIVMASGKEKNKRQAADALNFLQAIGVKSPGETEEIALVLARRYGKDGEAPSDSVYLADLKRFMSYLERMPHQKNIFAGYFVFRVDGDEVEWTTGEGVYLDSPYRETNLTVHYSSFEDNGGGPWPLSRWYERPQIDRKLLAQFAESCGAVTELPDFLTEARCYKNPKWAYLRDVGGERCTTPIDKDYVLSEEVRSILERQVSEYSRLIWNTLHRTPARRLYAQYQRNQSYGSRKAPAQYTYVLADLEWIPLSDGRFVKPSLASPELLPPGFSYDAGKEWLRLVGFAQETERQKREAASRAEKRASLGFKDDEELERAHRFTRLPKREQERFLSQFQGQTEDSWELPERPMRNRNLRDGRIRAQTAVTPERESEARLRAMAVGYEAAKTEAKSYLTEQYTNRRGVMFCQACQNPLPFKLPGGQYFYEAVEAVPGSAKRFREGFLALCPNHAAMYLYANDSKSELLDRFLVANGREVVFSLAGKEVSLYFTEVHLADLQSCLSTLETDPLEA
jgi:hypothetical protein